MAAKQTEDDVKVGTNSNEPGWVDPENRDKVVRKEPTKSFDERTSTLQPWQTSDGRQFNGAEDLPNTVADDTVEGRKPIEMQTAGTGKTQPVTDDATDRSLAEKATIESKKAEDKK